MLRKYTEPETLIKIVDFETVCEMWRNCVKEYGSNNAISDNGMTYTFNKLDEDMALFRTVLKAHDIKKGDYVGIILKNSYDFVKAYLSVVTLGAVAVLLPPHLDEMTVFGCSMKFGLKAMIFNEDTQDNVCFAKQKNPSLIFIEATNTATERTEMCDITGDSPCAVLFTGGTTGQSKGVLLSHRAIMKGTRNGCYGVKDAFEQRYFLVLPLTHVFGLIRNLMTSLYSGSDIYICRNNKDMFREMLMFKPTILVLVPALVEMALNLSKQFGRNMLGDDVKNIICGAATVPAYLKKECAKYGITLYAGYGLTESANLTSANPEPEKNPDSVGFPYPDQEIKIVDGELWLKGPNMMMGYVGDEEANKAAFSEDGWFKTGDLVRQDEEGFLYITGRIKELIVLPSGENISPAEYENEFNKLDIIQDSLIYELTEDGKSMLVLEVYPRMTELSRIDVEDKEKYIKDKLGEINIKLPSFARVSRIIIRDKDFKRSPNMKVLRNQN